MDTHHIHDEEIGFHSGTSEAAKWLRGGLSRDGVKDYLDKAKTEGSLNFKDPDGNKFKLVHNKEDGTFSVHTRH